MNHNVQYLLVTAFQNFPLATIKVHQTAHGWAIVLLDKMSNQVYLGNLYLPKDIEVTVEQPIKVENRIEKYF